MSRLWRVEVGGVSHRFVEADTKAQAVESVREALVRALDIRAAPAERALVTVYRDLGPIQRRRLLAAMDGLSAPSAQRNARSARRRLAREVRYDLELREQGRTWSRSPVDPAVLETLVRHLEINAMKKARTALRQFEREMYGDEVPRE